MVGFDVTPADAVDLDELLASPPPVSSGSGEVVVPRALPEVVQPGDRALTAHEVAPFSDQRACARRDVLGGEAELRQGDGPGRRRTEVVDAHDVVGVALPAEGRARLDRERGHVGGQHLLAVVVGLRGEEVPRRHRHHPHRQPVEEVEGADAQRHLGSGADEHEVEAVALFVDERVRAAGHPLRGAVGGGRRAPGASGG